MQMMRTTVTLPIELHRKLRLEAIKAKKSFSGVVVDKIQSGKRTTLSKKNIANMIKRDFALFDEVANSGLEIDLVKALREERDRDNA